MAPHVIKNVAVLGAGNGGKATSADLAMQGVNVRLWETPDFAEANLKAIMAPNEPVLVCDGRELQGTARLELVTDDLKAALGIAGLDSGAQLGPVDTIFLCTVVQAQELIARMLAPLLMSWPVDKAPLPVVILNPGSTGGSLIVAKVWKEMGMTNFPILGEFGTLTYGCRSYDNKVNVSVKVQRVSYGIFPAKYTDDVGPQLEKYFPGLFRTPTVLAAGLSNANPIIHPSITLLNLGHMENVGEKMLFYGDGATPLVCKMIKALDDERLELMNALGYGEVAMPDSTNSKIQGYADSDETYYECYGKGKGYSSFACPKVGTDLTTHRYLQEDIGCGLVFYHSLGKQVGLQLKTMEAMIQVGTVISGDDFMTLQNKNAATVGLDGMDKAAMTAFLEQGFSALAQ